MLDRAIRHPEVARQKPAKIRSNIVIKEDRLGYVSQYKSYKNALITAEHALNEMAQQVIGGRITQEDVARYRKLKRALRQGQKDFLVFSKKILIQLRDAKKLAAERKAKEEADRKARQEAVRKQAEAQARKAAEVVKEKEAEKDTAIARALDNVDDIESVDTELDDDSLDDLLDQSN